MSITGELKKVIKNSTVIRRVLGFVWHVVGVALCYYCAFILRLDSIHMFKDYASIFYQMLPIAVVNYLFFFIVFGLYQGLWSFISFRDCLRYAYVYALATAMFAGWVFLSRDNSFQGHPRTVFVIHYLLLMGWEIGGRGVMRLRRDHLNRPTEEVSTEPATILVGNPEECDQLIRSLINPRSGVRKIGAIVCEDLGRDQSTLHGVRVVGRLDRIGEAAKQAQAERVLILPPYVTPNAIKDIMGRVREAGVSADYRVIPSLKDIAHGHVDVSSLRRVEIEDLLNRKPNEFDRGFIERFLKGKSVMITGAGGSIGSEICRQVMSYGPERLILFDNSEYNLFEIHRELESRPGACPLFACMGDVKREQDLIGAIKLGGGIDVLYHAAAYKHVHLAEQNIPAVFLNNVLGTACAADVAVKMNVRHFILISTDKAVRPTSIMGASKRLAERCVLERPSGETVFKAVRFGNVLGSSGSVIPIFKKQIAEGGPVTVTSPDITRYFMTIPEAVELVLMAGAVGGDRNVMVLEMGDPVKIDQLARQLITLSGLLPDKDIEIRYTGLRKGEKEYEELLTEDENVVQTAYEKIWVMEKEDADLKPLSLSEIEFLVAQNDARGLRKLAIELIPGNLLAPD